MMSFSNSGCISALKLNWNLELRKSKPETVLVTKRTLHSTYFDLILVLAFRYFIRIMLMRNRVERDQEKNGHRNIPNF